MNVLRYLSVWLSIACFSCLFVAEAPGSDPIRPCKENPRFWEYKGKPVLLLGGTKDDNLFQLPDLKDHLDRLASVGGNYIRNTMSDRNNKGFELYPFKKLASGKYDLDRLNEEYWTRFSNMLRWTGERDIIVQIEVWDRFDYTRDNWPGHPYNPKNNVNYTYEETGFAKDYPDHPGKDKQPFFHTIPNMKKYEKKYDIIRKYQEAVVDKMLSYSLKYGNVLYCMNNETNTPAPWGQYWIKRIKQQAKKAGVEVYVTDMWDAWDIKSKHHHVSYDDPVTYTFVDISQNNHNKGDVHWDNLQWVRNRIANGIRPLNTVKIYGADTGRYGTSQDGQERFWRNILGGIAATRFHRPDSGLGLSELAQANLRSARLMLQEINIFNCTPNAKSESLIGREENEAFLTCVPGKQYALFFPKGGEVQLKVEKRAKPYTLRWLDIAKSKFGKAQKLKVEGKTVRLKSPNTSQMWIAVVK